jgi:HNH endonuclease
VIARDSDCAFPTCDRPKSWCDVHHVVHWAEGGTTALGNLVLLCRRHHGLVHAKSGFSMEMVNGRPVFKRPDGSVLLDRGPPSG